MRDRDRMFQVIVIGGMTLAGVAVLSAAGCDNNSAGTDAGAFPNEGAPDAYGLPVDAGPDAFPIEGDDAGQLPDAVQYPGPPLDAGPDADAFPSEGPDTSAPPLDAGLDVHALPDEGPETAPPDAAQDAHDSSADDGAKNDGA